MNLKKGLAIGLGIVALVGSMLLVGCEIETNQERTPMGSSIKARQEVDRVDEEVNSISSTATEGEGHSVLMKRFHSEFSNVTTPNEQGTPDGPSKIYAKDLVSAAEILQKRGEFGVVVRNSDYASCSPRYPDGCLELRWPARDKNLLKILRISNGQGLIYRFKAINTDEGLSILRRNFGQSFVDYTCLPVPAWPGIISVIEDGSIALIGPIPRKYWVKFYRWDGITWEQ